MDYYLNFFFSKGKPSVEIFHCIRSTLCGLNRTDKNNFSKGT